LLLASNSRWLSEIHVDVQPLSHDARGADCVLRVGTDRGEAGGAAGDGELPLVGRAAQVAELIGFELEADVELHAEVGVGAEQAAAHAGGFECRGTTG